MPARTRPNRRNLWLILPILPLLLLAFVYNSDLEKVAQAGKNLQLARDYNSRKEPQQAIGLVDNVLSQQPSVLLMKSEFQSVIDQIKIEKANALLLGQINETTLSRLIDEIRTEPARAEAERIKAILNDEKELKNAETLAQSGRWYEAEVIYLKHLNVSKMALRHRLKFHEILMKQGRLHEARSVYARGVFALDYPQDALLELAIKDNEETLPEKWTGEIELLSGIYPDDPRLQLATAFLESWRGNENRSAGILDKILEKWPDDAPTRNAAMKSAMALNNPAKARQMLEPLKITEPEALALAAWFSRNSESYNDVYQLLQNLLKLKPVDRKVISRLAELALLINQPAESQNYQNLKKTAEAKIVYYYRLCRNATPLSPVKAMELRNFASDLGLVFDAWVWGELATGRKPAPANQPLIDQKLFREWLPPEMISKIINQAGSAKPESMAMKEMPEIKFQNVAAHSGLGKFVHNVAQSTGQLIPPLSSAGGVGIIDFDNDGFEDVFAVQSGEFPPSPARPNSGDRLFRN
ncbi:MAG: tetratricopeptide repeat protein, partial [bacterium]